MQSIDQIPRPFIIEPPQELKTHYKKGDAIKFSLILIGKSIEYLPYFIFTFKKLGDIGIGKGRGKFKLHQVINYKGEKIYDSDAEVIFSSDSSINLAGELNSSPGLYLTLNFLTLARIKFRGKLVSCPDFHIIIRSLLHRISALSYFHCGVKMDIDYTSLINKAVNNTTLNSNLKWIDWQRYSARQDTRMKLGGFVGKITYKGDFFDFLPLLIIGKYTHIGKNCTFGLGKYEIIKETI